MIVKQIILICSLLVFVVSCRNHKQEGSSYVIQKTITFGLENIQNEDDFSECFSIENIIPLEFSDNPIGSVSKVLFDEGYLYIQDMLTNSLHKYSSDGKFVLKINSVGQGPAEYTELSDFVIFQNKVVILDSNSGNLLFYDSSGKFLKKESVGGVFKKMATDDDVFFLSNGNMTSFLSSDKSIAVINEKSQVLNNLIEIPKILKDKSLSSYKPFSSQGKRNLFSTPLSNDIFGFTKDSVWIAHRLDFGVQTLNEQFLRENDGTIVELLTRANRSGKVFGIDYLNETSEVLSFVSLYKGQTLMIFYSKEKDMAKIFSLDYFSSSLRKVCSPILNTHNDTFVTAVIPASFEQDSILQFIPEKLKNEENPVLVFYKLIL